MLKNKFLTMLAVLLIANIVLIILNISFNKEIDYTNLQKDWIEEFANIGKRHLTDKVAIHRYENLYGKYLGPYRNKKVNFLEIGLGCGMRYGAGKSLLTWKEYIPNIELTYIENEAECAEKFRDQLKNLIVGSQSDFDLLKKAEISGPYDVIVDDGGHSRKMNINALIGLWPFLKSGGVYIIEDLFYSLVDGESNDNADSILDVISKMLLVLNDPSLVKSMTKFVNMKANDDIPFQIRQIAIDLLSFECYERICAFVKKVLFCLIFSRLKKNHLT